LIIADILLFSLGFYAKLGYFHYTILVSCCQGGDTMVFRLKDLRTARNITQVKLSMDLNLSQNSISRYENMEREAGYATLISIADYFHVSLDYLLGRTDDPKMNP